MKKQSREYRKTLDKSRILCYIRYRYVRSPKTFPPASTGGLFLCVIVFLPYILILFLPCKRIRSRTAPHGPDVRRSPCRPHTFLCSFYPSYRSLLINCPVRFGKAIAEPFSAYPLLPYLRIPLRHQCRSAFC